LVNFYEFARFLRDGLGCRNALFLEKGEAPGRFPLYVFLEASWNSVRGCSQAGDGVKQLRSTLEQIYYRCGR
jgi:hypothetical protein